MDERIFALITMLEKEKLITDVFTVIVPNKKPEAKYKELLFSNIEYQHEDILNDINKLVVLFENTKHLIANQELYSLIFSIDFASFFNNDRDDLFALVYLKVLLTVYLSQGYIEKKYSKDTIKDTIQIDSNGKAMGRYYRGQSNYKYGLIPSIYRNLDYNGIISKETLEKLYYDSGLLEKYTRLINDVPIGVNYPFAAFMQHSAAYSPLLDFTTNRDIATVFATAPYDMNYNDYCNNDASLFILNWNQSIEATTEFLDFSNHNIQFYKSKLKFDSQIFGKPLYLCNIDDFLVKTHCCILPTNDRMKYQKGLFLYFEKCVIANGILFFPYQQGLIEKIKIPSNDKLKSKKELYKQITTSNPEIGIEHLLNPYLYFTEYAL